MKTFGKFLLIAALLMLGGSLIPARQVESRALGQANPPGPDRYIQHTVLYTQYDWWVIRWGTNEVTCGLSTEHEGTPTADEIYNNCGDKLYKEWAATQTCDGGDSCSGLYLMLVDEKPAQKEVTELLPAPELSVTLEDCPQRADRGCSTRPTLVISAKEPIVGEYITAVDGTVSGQPFHCEGDSCHFALNETQAQGVEIAFWALSSYGDSSIKYDALLHVVVAYPENDAQPVWYVDVLSSQWQGLPPASCSEMWDAFPTAGALPTWLTTPQASEGLETDIPYEILAGNLIAHGFVDARSCNDGGLTLNGSASPCGMKLARADVIEWQNRFDSVILSVGQQTGIPANLLKNMFSRESQLWPGGANEMDKDDVGFGQLTQNGADTTLLWNLSFYNEFCRTILHEETCSRGYALLEPEQQEMLRGALAQSVNASCLNCPMGLDLTKADESVYVFAETLTANCMQTSNIIQSVTRQAPGRLTSYEDLWKFTLVNYNAGPGCLNSAIVATRTSGMDLNWANLSTRLQPLCQGAIGYVNDITGELPSVP